MDTATLLNQIAKGAVVALIPNARPPEHPPGSDPALAKRWYSMREVGQTSASA